MNPFILKRIGSHILLIWLPCFLAAIYWGELASNKYVSDSKFIIKHSDNNPSSGLEISSLLGGGGFNSKDSYMIVDYILSSDMLDLLNKDLGLQAHFSDANIDILSRLPKNASREELLKHYRKHISVDYDEISSVITVSVQSYSPEMAQIILKQIIHHSEGFTNKIGHRIADEQVAFVSSQLSRAQIQVRLAQRSIVDFQNKHGLVLSPESDSQSLYSIINTLEATLATKRAELRSLSSYLNSSAPDIKQLNAEVSSLHQQIKFEKSRIVGKGEKPALNNLKSEFQDKKLNLEFGTDLYKSALTALEAARIEALRKLSHLVLIESPALPGTAEYPRRIYNFTTFVAFNLMLFWIGKLVVATIKDHKD